VFSVAVLPGSIVFLASALLSLAGEAGNVAHSALVRSILLVIQLLCALVIAVAGVIWVSLFFFRWPRCFIPPHLRELLGRRQRR